MKTKNLNYKDYFGSVDFDLEDQILHGNILFINDLITYEADNLDSLNKEFKAAVDDYLETCKLLGRQPQKAFKGSFNIRVGESIHKEAAVEASKRGQNLNDFCKEAITEKLARLKQSRLPTSPKIDIQIVKIDATQPNSVQTKHQNAETNFLELKERVDFDAPRWTKHTN